MLDQDMQHNCQELQSLGQQLWPDYSAKIERQSLCSILRDFAGAKFADGKYDQNFHLFRGEAFRRVTGRIRFLRCSGGISFLRIQDEADQLQILCRKNILNEQYKLLKHLGIGDFLEVEGNVTVSSTGELSIDATKLRLISKSLTPPPFKSGLVEEECNNQRHLDLLLNEQSRQIFYLRADLLQGLRYFLSSEREFLEVETPVLHPIPGGATARPFVTHHETHDRDYYLRIAPELYLKRLMVGGFEKVFEIGKNFRNEGVSSKHQPEFTSLEYYQAYANCRDLIEQTKEMLKYLRHRFIRFDWYYEKLYIQNQKFLFPEKFIEKTMEQAVAETAIFLGCSEYFATELPDRQFASHGERLQYCFDTWVEPNMAKLYPDSWVFITQHPIETSPLARANDENPYVADRFELYLNGVEVANGYTELNEPEEQAKRFRQQAEKKGGDDERMHFDQDYINCLKYGMPPTAGFGLGIDRFLMLVTGSKSIKGVILFPQ